MAPDAELICRKTLSFTIKKCVVLCGEDILLVGSPSSLPSNHAIRKSLTWWGAGIPFERPETPMAAPDNLVEQVSTDESLLGEAFVL